MPVNLKIYKQGRELMVAAADRDIVGKKFREGKLHIDVKPSFYGTEEADAETLVRHLRACTIANLVGENAVSIAVEHGFVNPGNIITIDGVPHAQIAALM